MYEYYYNGDHYNQVICSGFPAPELMNVNLHLVNVLWNRQHYEFCVQSSQRCDWSLVHSWYIYKGWHNKDFLQSKKAGGSCSHSSTAEIPSSLPNSLNLQIRRNLDIFKNSTHLWIALIFVNMSKKRQAGRLSKFCFHRKAI